MVSGPHCDYSPFAAKQQDECGILLGLFLKKGVAYTKATTPATSVSIGGRQITDWSPEGLDGALTAAGYDLYRGHAVGGEHRADPAGHPGDHRAVRNHLWPGRGIAVGDVPAGDPLFLVDPLSSGHRLFRRILPFISQYITARTGDLYAGLWYTWGVTLVALVVTLLWLHEDREGHAVA